MQKKGIFIRVTAAVCLIFAASCSLTNLNAVWKDPQYQGGKLKNVLVVGGSTNQVIRRIFEDEFTARLKTHGTNAIPSYNIFPSEKTLEKDTIDAKSQELGIDSLLIARVVDTKTKRELTPTRYSNYYRGTYFYNWPNRYSRFYSGPYPRRYEDEGSYFSEYEVVNIETNLYDTQTGELIWSGLSNTIVGGSSELEVSSIIEAIMKSLSENQLIN